MNVQQYYRVPKNVAPPGPDPDAFIMTFALGASDSITLPLLLTGTYDFYVNWGDGSGVDHITAWNQAERIHSYVGKPAGDYVVSITGVCNRWQFATVTTSRLKLKSIDQWGDVNFDDLNGGFFGCSNLTSIASDLIYSGDNFTNTFRSCGFTAIPSGLFDNSPNVTSFSTTFYQSSVTTVPVGLFDYCTLAASVNNTFEFSSVASIPAGLFDNNTLLTSLGSTFRFSSLSSIPAGLFDNNTLLSNLSICFQGCPITSLPSGLFDNNTALANLSGTFRQTSLVTIPLDLFDNCVNVTNYSLTFRQTPLTINVSSLVSGMTMTACTTTNQMFYSCASLTGNGQDLIDKPKSGSYTVGTGSGTGSYQTFLNCTALTDYATISANYK